MKNTPSSKDNYSVEKKKFFSEIDEELKSYALQNNLKLSKNYHGWPERSLAWKNSGISKQIQIYLEGLEADRFLLWGSAYKDRIFGRYWWKSSTIIFKAPLDWNKLEKEIIALKEILDKIDKSQLIKIKQN